MCPCNRRSAGRGSGPIVEFALAHGAHSTLPSGRWRYRGGGRGRCGRGRACGSRRGRTSRRRLRGVVGIPGQAQVLVVDVPEQIGGLRACGRRSCRRHFRGPAAARVLRAARPPHQFVDAWIDGLPEGFFAVSIGEAEDADLVGPENFGALHGAVEQSPLLVECALAFGRLGRQRHFEEPGAFDGDTDACRRKYPAPRGSFRGAARCCTCPRWSGLRPSRGCTRSESARR